MIILGSDQENKLLAKGGNYMELSIQIKKYRTELHLSQEELAEKVYVTRQTISNWENEKSYPDIHSLLLASKKLKSLIIMVPSIQFIWPC